MEKSFEIQIQMESSVVGGKCSSQRQELTPKTRKTLSPHLLTEAALTPPSDQELSPMTLKSLVSILNVVAKRVVGSSQVTRDQNSIMGFESLLWRLKPDHACIIIYHALKC